MPRLILTLHAEKKKSETQPQLSYTQLQILLRKLLPMAMKAIIYCTEVSVLTKLVIVKVLSKEETAILS